MCEIVLFFEFNMSKDKKKEIPSEADAIFYSKNTPSFWRAVGHDPNRHHTCPAEKRREANRLNILFSPTHSLQISRSFSKYWH